MYYKVYFYNIESKQVCYILHTVLQCIDYRYCQIICSNGNKGVLD